MGVEMTSIPHEPFIVLRKGVENRLEGTVATGRLGSKKKRAECIQ